MSKTYLLYIFSLIIVLYTNKTQAQAFEQGKWYANAQIGTNSGANLIGTIDYGIADNISVGIGIWTQSINAGSAGTLAGTSLLARGAYHLGDLVKVDKLDFYGGAEIAIGIGGVATTGFSLMPGVRYFITDNIGLGSELAIFLTDGGGTQFRLGAAFKF